VTGLLSDAAIPSAEDEVLLRVEHGDLARALDGLPPELRGVMQAVFLDGLTSGEAARLLGVPAGTASAVGHQDLPGDNHEAATDGHDRE
jgi:DNA-directed RNA polymerase specialized sigma24 family protein